MSTSRFGTMMARLWLRSNAPEYNPSVLDYLPKDGLVGYTTNNPRLAFLLLSEPAERFGFHVKDFSTFAEALDFEAKYLAAGSDEIQQSFNKMYLKSNADSGDVFNSNTVFTHQFPKTVEEAKLLEARDGGVNLFMHLEFEEGVSQNWDVNTGVRVLECHSCGKVVPSKAELLEYKHDPLNTSPDVDIGNKANCNQSTALCQWKEAEIGQIGSNEQINNQESSDLLTYFEKRGLLLNFKVNNDTPLNKARVELLRNIAGCFKL